MLRTSLIAALTCGLFGLADAHGQQTTDPADDKPIATLFDKPIYLKDLKIDNNKGKLRDYFAIAGKMLPPLIEKYTKDNTLEPTEEELMEFTEYAELLWAGTSREMEPAGQQDEANRIPQKNRYRQQNDPKKPSPWAIQFVHRWKLHKSLYDKYGGRTIFQQFGDEPIDAYRKWLKDEEKAGSFQLHDPQWRDAFWEYYKIERHHGISGKEDTFEDADVFKVPFWKMPTEAKK